MSAYIEDTGIMSQNIVFHPPASRDLVGHGKELRGQRLMSTLALRLYCVRGHQLDGVRSYADSWIQENIFLNTKVNTRTHREQRNVIWTIFQRTLSPDSWKWLVCWLWSRMPSSIVSVMQLINRRGSGVGDGMPGMYGPIPAEFNRAFFQTFLWHIHYRHLHGRLIHSIQMLLERWSSRLLNLIMQERLA